MGIFDLFRKSPQDETEGAGEGPPRGASGATNVDPKVLEGILEQVRQGKAKAFFKLPATEINLLAQWTQVVVDQYCAQLLQGDRDVMFKSRDILPRPFEDIRLALIVQMLCLQLCKAEKQYLEKTYACYQMLSGYIDLPQERLKGVGKTDIPADVSEKVIQNEKELKRFFDDFLATAKIQPPPG